MEQVVKNILAPAMEAKIVTVIGQVEKLQNKVDAMVKSFDTMQDSGEKWKEVVGRKVDKVANKVDRATDADLVKVREANIRVTVLTMSKGETSKQLMELVQTKLLDRLKVADRVHVQKVHRQMPSGRLDKATDSHHHANIDTRQAHDVAHSQRPAWHSAWARRGPDSRSAGPETSCLGHLQGGQRGWQTSLLVWGRSLHQPQSRKILLLHREAGARETCACAYGTSMGPLSQN
jgi:hypothetical protein